MKICFFCGGFNANGGIGRVTSVIAKQISLLKLHDIFLCSFFENDTSCFYDIDSIGEISVLYEKPITMSKAMLFNNAIGKLVKYIKNKKIEVIVACGALYFPLVLIAARIARIKVVCWEHISPIVNHDYKFQMQARMFGTRYCDCNVVLTKEALNWYRQNAVYKKIIQIYNPVDPIAVSMGQKQSYNINSKKIVSVGRLAYQKNFSRLIDIAKIVISRHPDWTWDIYGEGDERINLENKILAYGLDKNVFLKGQVNNIYSKYNEYSMIVMTSRYEGFPMVLLEAAAFGLPMVSFDIKTGPNEIIHNNFNGFICDKNRDDEMIETIVNLIENPINRITLSENCKKTALEFSMEKVVQEWQSLFQGL